MKVKSTCRLQAFVCSDGKYVGPCQLAKWQLGRRKMNSQNSEGPVK